MILPTSYCLYCTLHSTVLCNILSTFKLCSRAISALQLYSRKNICVCTERSIMAVNDILQSMVCHSACWWFLCNIPFSVVPSVVSFNVLHDLFVFVMSLDAMRHHSFQCCANHPVPQCSSSSISVSRRSSCPSTLCVIHLCCVSCVVSFNTLMHDLFAFVMSLWRAFRHPYKCCANHDVPRCYASSIFVVWYSWFICVPRFLVLLVASESVTIASLQEW